VKKFSAMEKINYDQRSAAQEEPGRFFGISYRYVGNTCTVPLLSPEPQAPGSSVERTAIRILPISMTVEK
jgi:hypothetical protein